MSLPSPLYDGTAVTTTCTFTVPGESDPVDPTVVTLSFRVSSGSVTTWTYLGSGSIVRVSEGVYSAELDTTELPGSWALKWQGTDACAAVGVTTFPVTPTPF